MLITKTAAIQGLDRNGKRLQSPGLGSYYNPQGWTATLVSRTGQTQGMGGAFLTWCLGGSTLVEGQLFLEIVLRQRGRG